MRYGILVAALAALSAGKAPAQENQENDERPDEGATPVETLDLTMELMPEGATRPDAVTRIIELPAVAAEAARENTARGLDAANAAREGADPGADIAEEAQVRSLERAQQVREDVGRGRPEDTGPPEPGDELGPGGPPDTPGPPENPGPPGD